MWNSLTGEFQKQRGYDNLSKKKKDATLKEMWRLKKQYILDTSLLHTAAFKFVVIILKKISLRGLIIS